MTGTGADIVVRHASAEDSAAIATLIDLFGDDPIDADGVRTRLADLAANDMPQLVGVRANEIVGLCGLHCMTSIDFPLPIGRITVLMVRPDCRRIGVGRLLVGSAEKLLAERGCDTVEITSSDHLADAHQLYRTLGYRDTSRRFAKRLA